MRGGAIGRAAIDVNSGTVHPVRLKFPRLVRVNRGSMSDSCTSSGHRSALTAIDWLQRWSAQFTSSPRAPLSRISAKVTLCGLARVAMVDVKTGAALKGIRVVAPIPRIGLYGPAVTQESLVAPPTRWVAASPGARQWTPQSHLEA